MSTRTDRHLLSCETNNSFKRPKRESNKRCSKQREHHNDCLPGKQFSDQMFAFAPVTLKRVSTSLVSASQSYAIPCRTLLSVESGRRRRQRRRQDLSNVMPERDAGCMLFQDAGAAHSDTGRDLFLAAFMTTHVSRVPHPSLLLLASSSDHFASTCKCALRLLCLSHTNGIHTFASEEHLMQRLYADPGLTAG